MRSGITALATAVVIALAGSASAHPLDLGYLRIATKGPEVAISLDLDINAAAIILGVDPGTVDASMVGARAATLAAGSYARAPITTDGGPCTWSVPTASLSNRTVKISGTASCPAPGPRRWAFPVVKEGRISAVFELMVKESILGSERLTLVDKTTTEITLGGVGAPEVGFSEFVWSGVEHIGAAPNQWRHDDGSPKLPDGIDHIMFLLALMLGGGTLLKLIGVASGFTLGHSITLALAALDIVRPPARLIEPLIALTIALAAVEAFTGRFKAHRWKIAAGFGLIHGFGFATALDKLDLTTRGKVTALFGYNIGVEIGQVIIVLVVAPLVMLVYRKPSVEKVAVRTLAGMIFVLGVYWFVTRSFGLR